MPSRRAAVVAAVTAAQALMFWLTIYVPGLGTQGWHHVASLAFALAVAVVWRRPFARSRRFLAMGVLALTVLATASGFWLLYWKEGIRASGYQDWGVWWHVLWSWAAAVFFFQHTWINRVAFVHFLRRSFAGPVGLLHASAYVLFAAAFVVTWSDLGKGWFHVENYVPLSLWAWLLATVPPYAGWWAWRLRAARWRDHARDRLRRSRVRSRAGVDVALVPLAALAVLSGVPLTFFDPQMDAAGWKYVSKFWHVWPSVAFAVLVFAHGIQAWRAMRVHWRSYERQVGPPGTPTAGMPAEA